MNVFPRGIDPVLLVSQVRNTMPYLFEGREPFDGGEPAEILKRAEAQGESLREIGHLEYFQLCLSAHYLTCATPVPTDVDNQIRKKLWPQGLPLETALSMADFVLQSLRWDFTLLSSRFVKGAISTEWEKETLSGHEGEWFTVATGAYCALLQYSQPKAREKAQEIYTAIASEVERHAEVFASLWRAKDGISALKASASVAHNLGDMDRVMEMWELSLLDPLRQNFYKLSHSPFDASKNLRYMGRLWVAGELYKSRIDRGSMAAENHRHFALRKPRCLRLSPALRIPTAPFLEEWGQTVGRYLSTQADSSDQGEAQIREVAEALAQGWERLGNTVGYARALRGLDEVRPDLHLLEPYRKKHEQRAVLELPAARFEKKWNDEALHWLDEIPSQAE